MRKEIEIDHCDFTENGAHVVPWSKVTTQPDDPTLHWCYDKGFTVRYIYTWLRIGS